MPRLMTCGLLVAVMLLTACENKPKEGEVRYDATRAPEGADSTSTGMTTSDPYATDPMVTSGGSPMTWDTGSTGSSYDAAPASPARTMPPAQRATPVTTSDPIVTGSGGGGDYARAHVVQRGDTLIGLARKYYGNQSRWREIYDANRDKISSPNKLKVGTQLVIP